jgi:hypothetical protein
MDAAELNRLVDGAHCRITDDDFDKAGMSAEDEQALIEKMVDRGYTIGLDEDFRNVWWPPERSE